MASRFGFPSRHVALLLQIATLLGAALLGDALVCFMPLGEINAEGTNVGTANPFLASGDRDRGWPFIRGPDFDGHSAEIQMAEAWPAGGPPILWRRKLGQGYSGFVVAGRRVYTQYQSLAGQFVICLDADTGKTIWEFRYDWPFEHQGMYPGPRATPTLAEGRIYFAGPSGLVGCLNENGRLLWSLDVNKKFAARGTEFGYSCSPTVVDGRVILPVGGKGAAMVCLEAKSGSVIWQSGDEPASYTPAMPITQGGRRQVVGQMENWLVSHEMETGTRMWSLQLSNIYDEHAAWPIYRDGCLWVSGPFQAGSRLLQLPATDGADVQQLWQSKRMSNDVASSVLVGDYIYGFDLKDLQTKPRQPSRGTFRCMEFLTGEVQWSQGDAKARRRGPRLIHSGEGSDDEPVVGQAGTVVADGKLFLLNDVGELILVRANPRRYEELARAQIFEDQLCWTPPALNRGRLYARTHSQAVCIYVGVSELLDAHEPSRNFDAASKSDSPALATTFGIRPEYAFQVPSNRQLFYWYVVSLGLLGVAGVLAGAARLAAPSFVDARRSYWMFLCAAFAFALAGTTLLSHWQNIYVFTWPLGLLVALLATIDQLPMGKPAIRQRRSWQAAAVTAVFASICLAYFFLCRQFSLAAEWVFLTGFLAAVPIAVMSKRLNQSAGRTTWQYPLATLAFTVYYWMSVALLYLKYGGENQ